MTAERWLERVAAAPVGRLATTRLDGRVDLVPFVYAWRPGAASFGRLYSAVDHKPKRHTRLARLTNVSADPRVTVLIDEYDDDWDRLWWVRLRGLANVTTVRAEPEGRAALSEKYRQYRERPLDDDAPMLVVDVEEVTGWSAAPR